jgi:hypothetical protein
LHTLNVTSDFIRKAVSELSGHYTVSKDGQKVRWNSSWGLVKKRRHGDGEDLSRIASDGISVAKDKRLKTTRSISSRRASLRAGMGLKPAPTTWISHQKNGKLVFAPRFHFSSKGINNRTSSLNTGNAGRAIADAGDIAKLTDGESV